MNKKSRHKSREENVKTDNNVNTWIKGQHQSSLPVVNIAYQHMNFQEGDFEVGIGRHPSEERRILFSVPFRYSS